MKTTQKLLSLACAATISLSSLCMTTEALGGETLTSAASSAVSSIVSLDASFTSKKVTLKSDYTCTTSAVRLNWNKVSGASGYRIYKYDSSAKKWVKVKTVKGGSTTTARITGLSAGSKYRFKVKAYKHYNGKTYWSKASTQKYIATKPKQVTMKASTATQNAIRLNWKKVKCDGYKIYQKVGNSYKIIATVRDGDTTTYRVTGNELLSTNVARDADVLESGAKYSFKVRAYRKDTAGKVVYGKCGVKVKTTKYDMSNELDKYIANNITSNMTNYEKLCKLCEFPCSFDYDDCNCITGAIYVYNMARKLGFSAVVATFTSRVHSEVVVYMNGNYYVCNLGYYGNAPRDYSIKKYKTATVDGKNVTTKFWNACSGLTLFSLDVIEV
ncbi:MAG: fibronectin type III domain-containing protein [Ruminococcus sp.]|nr:fibronectin type III domain-containing protein [Ruminococcus sp.]